MHRRSSMLPWLNFIRAHLGNAIQLALHVNCVLPYSAIMQKTARSLLQFTDTCIKAHLISSQYLNLAGCRGTTDDVATIPFHLFLSSAALNSIPAHSRDRQTVYTKDYPDMILSIQQTSKEASWRYNILA